MKSNATADRNQTATQLVQQIKKASFIRLKYYKNGTFFTVVGIPCDSTGVTECPRFGSSGRLSLRDVMRGDYCNMIV